MILVSNIDAITNATTGKVHYKSQGSAPNRVLIIEWKDLLLNWSATGTTLSTFQLRLYESGKIESVYGQMWNSSTSSQSSSIGFSSSNTTGTIGQILTITGTPAYSSTATSYTTTSFTASSAMTNLNSAANGSRRVFTFTPPVVAADPTSLTYTAITGTTITPNWVDNSTTETGFLVTRATDAGFTANVVTTTVASTTAAGTGMAYTLPQTGLNFGTTYYYKIQAINEGAVSAGLTGSQATSAGSISGIKTVGTSGDYTNLTTAFAAINSNGLAGNIELQLITGYPAAAETFPIATSNAASVGAYSVKVYPTVSGLTITGSSSTGLININNGTNITFDGRVNQTGAKNLIISNTSTGTGAYAIQFINDAIGNTIKYCTVKSLNSLTTSGVILFSTTTGSNGNDNNTIDNCDIDGGAGATASPTSGVARNGIYASGTTTTTAQNNSGNTISNCNIFNTFFTGATATSAGILISTGNTDWTINANSIYQTAARAVTTGAATIYGISIANSSSGNNFVVTNNYVGGSTSNAGGSAWTVTGAQANRFNGIGLSVGTATPSSVQGNTVANISFASTSSASTNSTSSPLGSGVLSGIYVGAGSANIGTSTANIIGASTGTGSISVTVSTNAGASANGFGCSGSGTVNISNNVVGSITTNGGTGAISTGIIGILSNATGTVTINNNTIGSTTTANSINASLASTGTTGQLVTGISNTGAATSISITNNTIANINNAYVPTTAYTANSILRGIASSSGVNTITGNTIRDLSTAANATGTTSAASVIGISLTSSTTGTTVSQNTIYALSNSHATAAAFVTGIHYGGPTSGSNVIAGNNVYNLGLATTSATAEIRGINFASGLATVQNNFVRLGYNASGTTIANGNIITGIYEVNGTANSAVYYNSVHIGGSGVGTQTGNTYAFRSEQTTNARIFRNNIFSNERSNSSAGGKHYAVRIAGTSGLTINNNDYFVSGTDGVLGVLNTTDATTLVAWQTATGQDAQSLNANPMFVAPAHATAPDLHITSGPSSLESAAATIAGITTDFDGETRPGTPSASNTGSNPDIGADEFEGTILGCVAADAGTITPLTATRCIGTTYAMTAIGASAGPTITYQWEVSTIGGGVGFANVSDGTGATTTAYTTGTLAAGTFYYRLKATCTDASVSDYSDEVIVTVNALPSVNVTPSTGTICIPGGSGVALTAGGATTYAWTPSTGLSATTGTSVTATPSATSTYTVTGTDAAGCTNTATAVITVSTKPTTLTVSPSTSTICSGGIQVLTASGGLNNLSSSSIGSGSSFTGATDEQTAFCNRRANYVGQTIYTAAELLAAGVVAGNITSLAYNINSNGDATTNASYTVKIGHVGSTENFPSTSFFTNTGYTTVYGPATYTHTSPGWQVITFSTPFVWDGVSNICVDVRHNGADDIDNAQTQYSTTAGNASLYGYNTPSVGIQTTTRLNIILGYSVANSTISWSPVSDLYTDAGATIAYTGSPSTNTVYAKLTSGATYTATATNSNGCTSTGSASITISAGAAITTDPISATKCQGLSATFTVVATGPGLTYQWRKDGSPLSNSGTISGATSATLAIAAVVPGDAGNYDVVVSSTCGSPVTSAVAALVVNAAPTIAVTPSTGTICNPGGSPIALTASGTSTSYAWSPATGLSATTGANVTASPTGTTTYVVTGTDGNGCTNTSSSVITVSQAITATATATAATICSGENSQLNVTVSGISSPIKITEVTLYNLGTGQTVSYPSYITGADLVEVSNTSGSAVDISGWTLADYASNATTTTHTALTFPSGTIIPANGVAVVCLGTGTDDIPNRYFNTGGTSDSWSSGGLVGIVLKNGATVMDAVGLNSGYVFNAATGVTASDWSGFAPSASGIAGTIRSAVSDNNAGSDWSQSSAGTPQTVGTYNGGYIAPASVGSYAWSPSTFLSATDIVNPVATAVTATTTYSVLVTTSAGCTATANTTVTVSAGAAITTDPTATTKCEGQTATFTVAATGPGLIYSWRKGGSPLSNGGNITGATSATLTITGVTSGDAGSYDVIVSSSCGTPLTSAAASLVLSTPPTVTVSPTSGTICNPGGSAISLSAGGAVSYTWSPATGLSATTGTSVDALPSNTTTYTVTGTDGNGCTNTATSVITVGTIPTVASVTATPATICSGENSQLLASASLPFSSMTFNAATGASLETITTPTTITTVSAGTLDDGSNAVTPSPAFSFVYNGTTYTDFSANTNGWLKMGATTPSSNIPSSLTSIGSTNGIYAFGRDANMNVTNAGNLTHGPASGGKYVFQFTKNSGGSGGAESATAYATMQIVLWGNASASPGKIEIIYGTTAGTPVSSGTIGVSNSAGSYINAVTGNSTALTNAASYPATGTVYSFTPGVITYSWTPSTFLSATNIANPIATAVTSTTTYSVTAANGACESSPTNVTVTISSGAAITTQPLPQAKCVGGTTTFTVAATGPGLTYQWRLAGSPLSNGGTISGATSPTLTIAGVVGGDAGNYDVVVTSTCGSPVTSNAVALTVETTFPTAVITPSSPYVCGSGTATLTASGGVTYAWAANATLSATNIAAPTATPIVTTTYTVTVTNAGGCTATTSQSIAVNPLVSIASVTASPASIACGGSSNLLVTPAVSSYCTPSATTGCGAGDEYISNVTFGTINNSTSCGATTYSDFTAQSTTVAAGATGLALTFDNPNYFSGDQFKVWIDWNQNGLFTDAGEEYTGTGTTTVSFSIDVPAGAATGSTRMRVRLTFSSGMAPCGVSSFGETEDYTVNVTGGSSAYTYSWSDGLASVTNPTAMPTATTNYSVVITASTGCTASGNVLVTVGSCNATLNLTAFIEGYMDGATMRPVKMNSGIGASSTDCDDITVELHNASSPYAMVETFTGMLQTDGTLACTFTSAVVGNSYYIVLKHRNALETWSGAPVTISASTSYNFSTGAGQAYGNNMVSVGGIWCLYSGDVSLPLDGFIDNFDYIIWEADYNSLNSGYLQSDINGSGDIDNFDYIIWEANYNNLIEVVKPF